MADNKRGVPKRRQALGPKADRHSPDARAIEDAVWTASSMRDPALLATIARPYAVGDFHKRMMETERIVLEASGPADSAFMHLIADSSWMTHYVTALGAYAMRAEMMDEKHWYSERHVYNTGEVARPDAKLPFAVTGGMLKRGVEALHEALRDCPNAVYPSLLACVLAHQRLQAEVEAADRRVGVASKGGVSKKKADRAYGPIRAQLETWAPNRPEWESAKAKLRTNPRAHLPEKLLNDARAYVLRAAKAQRLAIPTGGVNDEDDLPSRWLRALIKEELRSSR